MATTQVRDLFISGLREKHRAELENLTLTNQPLRTLKLFVFAITQWIHQAIQTRAGWFMFSSTLVGSIGILVITVGKPHEMTQELFHYVKFGLWWLAHGVASSIGLGSGLHTFVLYLGPHIAFFTMKAVQCGRVDLKTALYYTIRLNTGPSWLNKDCSEYGPPLFPSARGSRVPLSSILPQVQLEAILWGTGTALGELPP
ncbi:vacuole membrane protein KMS1-like [Hibiscus syriacus]|uniref:vacuole membrane protein KMS1-like n=1 Tax=Hibiscus syriacus TaxID=106335 RepID=UPI0019246534|nr:vacuole membrane protein KMS1-like [Hibiscus syriacus]